MAFAHLHSLSRLAVALLVCAPVAAQEPAGQAQQVAPLIDVRGQLLPDAQRTLNTLGFRNVRVAHQWMDDMPAGVVLWQYPVPPLQPGAVSRVPVALEFVLIVVQPLPVLPDLRDWRADHALTLVASHGWQGALDVAADAARSVVTGQSVEPRPLQPGESVTLSAAPLVMDTVQLRDTVAITDTVFAGGGGVQPWVVALIGAGALALGGLGASTLLRRPTVPRVPEPRTPASPARPDEPRTAPRRLDVAAFEPMIIDELVWVTHGSARREGGAP